MTKNNEIPTTDKAIYNRFPQEEIKITELMAVRDKETGKINQLRFITDKNETITHKPYLRLESKISDLLDVIEREKTQPDITQLHKNIYRIHEEIKQDDICIIMAGFTEMQTVDKKGKKVVFRFFTDTDIANLKFV
jgi:hypothetical protein